MRKRYILAGIVIFICVCIVYVRSTDTFNQGRLVTIDRGDEILDDSKEYQQGNYKISEKTDSQIIEEKMKILRPLDYCLVGEWVYYVTLGDQEGFHKMSLDGSEDTIICDLGNIENINGSTSLTSEVCEGYILYKVQPLRQVDEHGVLEPPYPIDYYKLNLADNKIERLGNIASDYLSITSTTYINPDTEEMTTSIHRYIPSTGKLDKIFSFPYTSQYPLGVLSPYDNTVYYTKRDEANRDQIYSYNLNTKEDAQLTTKLRAVNQIIPTNDKIFFVASLDKALRLGVLDKKDNTISYWGDEDKNVETIVLNPHTQKIYLASFSYSQDKAVIKNQFISDENQYSMPLFTIYETDYTFTDTKELFWGNVWIRSLLIDFTRDDVIAIYDKEYNSEEASKAIRIDTDLEAIENFALPPERMQVDGGSFSIDGKGLYVMSVINDQRGIYYYDLIAQTYTPIFIVEDAFINNFQHIKY